MVGPLPTGGETHSYVFTLYALSESVSLDSGMAPDEAIGLIQGASAATDIGDRGLPVNAEVRVATFAELTPLQLYRILKLRADVFVVEQDCVYPDIDDRDLEPDARHMWIEHDDIVVAYLRVVAEPPGGVWRIGRVVTAATCTRRGARVRPRAAGARAHPRAGRPRRTVVPRRVVQQPGFPGRRP